MAIPTKELWIICSTRVWIIGSTKNEIDMAEERLVSYNGDYKNLLTYKKTDIIYQITYFFCKKFLSKGDRTIDQMIQASRSGKQNIIEGCAAATTSSKTHIHLLNVAKGSLKELVEDYEDFLKTRNHRIWQKGEIEFETMRELGRTHGEAYYFMKIIETRPPETIANMAIILIRQADYLLFRQIKSAEEKFIREGGFKEKMTRIRRDHRGY